MMLKSDLFDELDATDEKIACNFPISLHVKFFHIK